MVAYKFYWIDKTEKAHFIGILRQTKAEPLRMTKESVLNYGRKVIGSNGDISNIYFTQVKV
jgi:hypothetical protein